MASGTPRPVRVAYCPDPVKLDSESGYPPPAVRELLAEDGAFVCELVTVADILMGCLEARCFTVLCIPGGFAPNYDSHLGTRGADIIREFVCGGGGFIGLCAGAYLGSTACLGLLPVNVLDVHRWARGCGPCQLAFTTLASNALGSLGPATLVTVRYANGPIMQIEPGKVAVHPLAHYATEFAAESLGGTRDFPPIMMGSPAVVLGYCGDGLVALVSPHLEDGADERSHTPFRNLFHLCSCGSLYQRWCLDGTDLSALAQSCALFSALTPGGTTKTVEHGPPNDSPPLDVLPALCYWSGRIVDV